MTAEQYRLYNGILRLFSLFGTGGGTWRRTRAAGGGPAANPTLTQVGGFTLRFCQNNRIREASTLPQIPIFTAPWWGVAAAGVDIAAGDVLDNGTLAFLVTGTPDTSQGFQVVPSTAVALPRSITLGVGAGFRAGLRIGAN